MNLLDGIHLSLVDFICHARPPVITESSYGKIPRFGFHNRLTVAPSRCPFRKARQWPGSE